MPYALVISHKVDNIFTKSSVQCASCHIQQLPWGNNLFSSNKCSYDFLWHDDNGNMPMWLDY